MYVYDFVIIYFLTFCCIADITYLFNSHVLKYRWSMLSFTVSGKVSASLVILYVIFVLMCVCPTCKVPESVWILALYK